MELDARTVVRWEVVAVNPLLPRTLLLRAFAHAVESASVLYTVREEGRQTHDRLHAALLIGRRVLRVILSATLLLFLLFGSLWGVGAILQHPTGLVVLTYGLATWLTVVALYEAITYLLKESALARGSKVRNIQLAGFGSLPLLMYAIACPATTVFLLPGAQSPPGFWDWSTFYGYMMGNILTLGALEGLFGELTAFQPPSLFAALSTFWIETLMLIGVVGVFFNTLRDAFATSHTFVGTIAEFRAWARRKFRHPLHEYLVFPRATEEEFVRAATGTPLISVRDIAWPEWQLHADGSLTHPMGGLARDPGEYWKTIELFLTLFSLANTKRSERILRSQRQREQAKTFGYKLALSSVIAMLAFASIVFMAAGAAPMLLLLHWVGGVSWDFAFAWTALAVVIAFSVDVLLTSQKRSALFIALSTIQNRACFGGGPPAEEDPDLSELFVAQSRSRDLLLPIMLWNIGVRTWRMLRASAQRHRLRQSGESRGERHGFGHRRMGALSAFVTVDRKTAWLLHNFPLAAQNGPQRVVFDFQLSQLIIIADDGSQELLDGLTFNAPWPDAISACDRIVTLWYEGNRAPSRPKHVHDVPLIVDRSTAAKGDEWSPQLHSLRSATEAAVAVS